MYCHIHQKIRNEAQRNKSNNNTKNKNKKQHTHTKSKQTHNHQAVTWQLPVYGWKGSIEARGDNLVSSRRMQMTTYVPCWRRPINLNNNRTNHKITMGHFRGCRKQQSSMRKPGIPPARIPEITESSLQHNITPWHFEANTDKAGSQRKWWERLPQWNRKVKDGLRWEWQEGYGTQGTLRVRSVVLFQSSYSQGLCMCIPRVRKGLVLSGFFPTSASELRLRWAPQC